MMSMLLCNDFDMVALLYDCFIIKLIMFKLPGNFRLDAKLGIVIPFILTD